MENLITNFSKHNVSIIKAGENDYFINFSSYWEIYQNINSEISDKHLITDATFDSVKNIITFYFSYCSEEGILKNSHKFDNITNNDRNFLEQLVEIITELFSVEFNLEYNSLEYNILVESPDDN
jgi:hypothetical protein